jgi:hypothetical protein
LRSWNFGNFSNYLGFFSKLHFKRFSNLLFFQPQYGILTKNKVTSLVWIQFCWCVILALVTWEKKKKNCNSQCFYFHICDIEVFGEIFPLNSEIGRDYTRKWRSSKISQKTIYRQKK